MLLVAHRRRFTAIRLESHMNIQQKVRAIDEQHELPTTVGLLVQIHECSTAISRKSCAVASVAVLTARTL
jgi:hypothetical protein